jgi:uncharacterized small protein (DUF1192 family)
MDDEFQQFAMNGRLSGAGQDALEQVVSENLDHYSLDELDGRVARLEAEIARVKAHRGKAAAHRLAADSLFRAPE